MGEIFFFYRQRQRVRRGGGCKCWSLKKVVYFLKAIKLHMQERYEEFQKCFS